jgi:hypothetical protein
VQARVDGWQSLPGGGGYEVVSVVSCLVSSEGGIEIRRIIDGAMNSIIHSLQNN